jgi:hypothetical protein
MTNPTKPLACLVLLVVLISPALLAVSGALPPLAAGTFPVGTYVVPMDGKQADRVRVYGFIHEFLRSAPDLQMARVIEPPDVSMQTALTPSGAVYQGGPFLIEVRFSAQINALLTSAVFNQVTVTRLTAPFTSNQIFFVRQPTTILVIKGIWGRTDLTLDQMKINYTLVNPDDVLANPSIVNQYSLIVLDCPGWFGDPTTFTPAKQAQVQAVYNNIRTHIQAGNEIIFTDIALKDLDKTFPGYVNLLGPNGPGSWASVMHNPPAPAGSFPGEFPSQYYNAGPNPNNITLITEGGGFAVASVNSAHVSDVRVLMDSNKFGVPFRRAILAFYFQFGNGIVEGLGFHPQQQLPVGSPSFYAVEQVYGNKFIHGPQVDFILAATPPVITVQAGSTATYSVTVTSIGSFSSQVNLQVTGLPSSSSSSFSPSSVTPPVGGTATSQMTISTSESTPVGTYNLTITGTSLLPAILRTTVVTLIVTVPPPDFSISATPPLLVLNVTQCGNYTVSIVPQGNFSSPVALNATGLPQKTTFISQPNPVTPPTGVTVTSNLQVCAAQDATPGNYTLTISGSSTPLYHTTNVLLRVQKPVSNVNVLLLLLLLLLALGLALLFVFLIFRRKVRRPVAVVPAPVPLVRRKPRVVHVLPLPMIRCRWCGRVMPMHAVYCPYCGRPQVILARAVAPIVRPTSRVGGRGIFGFALSLVSGILVLLNAGALLSPSFFTLWSGIFFWLPTIGPLYGFALGMIIGLVIIMGSIIMVLRNGALADIIIFPFAVFSLIIGGGFIAGMLLGIVGGIIGALKR